MLRTYRHFFGKVGVALEAQFILLAELFLHDTCICRGGRTRCRLFNLRLDDFLTCTAAAYQYEKHRDSKKVQTYIDTPIG